MDARSGRSRSGGGSSGSRRSRSAIRLIVLIGRESGRIGGVSLLEAVVLWNTLWIVLFRMDGDSMLSPEAER
jgi:hypothetical protein